MFFKPFYSAKADKFYNLMKYHVQDVLLVASPYDAYILEEDGALTKRIFNDFIELDLHYIPRITRVYSAKEALEFLKKDNYDLVITMPRLSEMTPIEFGKRVKEIKKDIPVVLLTYVPVEKDVLMLVREKKYIDKVFYWMGDSKLFLAIIKYIEDEKNAERDTKLGVNVILIVEDSPWYYSFFLPLIYTEILKQTRKIIRDTINESDVILRVKARPKILTAETYDDAIAIYEKYKSKLLGIISDVQYPKGGKLDANAGFELVKKVKSEVKDLNVILQSSNLENKKIAKQLGVDFFHKLSKKMAEQLRKYILKHFGFGDFVFKYPNGRVIDRAKTLEEFAEKILNVPDESVLYHASHNHFSIWFRARTQFEIAEVLRPKTIDDFKNVHEIKVFLHDTILKFLNQKKLQSVISLKALSDAESAIFVKIGDESLGGKARGLSFIQAVLSETGFEERFPDVDIKVPFSTVLATDIYESFLHKNRLMERALEIEDDEEIKSLFLNAKLPRGVERDLGNLLKKLKTPIAVRSSSIFEDSQTLSFAGVYKTFMLANNEQSFEHRLANLIASIKLVYASVFSSAAKKFIKNTNYNLGEEKMAVLIQKVVGKKYGKYYFPVISGVAQSYNYYPIANLKPEDGIVYLAFGLGRIIEESNRIKRVSPKAPLLDPMCVSPEQCVRNSQKYFYALNLDESEFDAKKGELSGLEKIRVANFDINEPLNYVSEYFNTEDGMLSDFPKPGSRRVITFKNILSDRLFPFSKLVSELLKLSSNAIGEASEIEFSVNFNKDSNHQFFLLQNKPLPSGSGLGVVLIEKKETANSLCVSNEVLGNGVYNNLKNIVIVSPYRFNRNKTGDIALEIANLNREFKENKEYYILLVPGRLGSSDPWNGVPVNFKDISNAKVVVEYTMEDFRVEPSKGNHFFQNMLSSRMAYFYIDHKNKEHKLDWAYFEKLEPLTKGFLDIYNSNAPFIVKIDGKSGFGIIKKPLC